jgi:hypothetical protein
VSSTLLYNIPPTVFWTSVRTWMEPSDIPSMLLKALVFGFQTAVLACGWGLTTRGGPQGGGLQHHRCRGDDPRHRGADGRDSHPDPVRLNAMPPTETLQHEPLAPRFWVPLGVVVLAAASLALLPLWAGVRWVALVIALLGIFLAVQAALLRLRFSDTALLVSRRDTVIREFPYSAWVNWKIFWFPFPVLFYFREKNSPHLLPMLFDGRTLRKELEQRIKTDQEAPSPP